VVVMHTLLSSLVLTESIEFLQFVRNTTMVLYLQIRSICSDPTAMSMRGRRVLYSIDIKLALAPHKHIYFFMSVREVFRMFGVH
jgi:hypothetical protein